jgi:peptide deformylase
MFFKHKNKYTVYTYGADVLKQVAEPINDATDEIKELANYMLKAMRLFDGIGLAGPQVGISKRIVALAIPAESASGSASPGEALLLPRMPMVVINPEITAFGPDLALYDEGCLSVPELYAPVERPLTVMFRAQTIDGELIECECGGLLARCLQHEIDHLDGMLFVDRLIPEELEKISQKLKKLKKSGSKRDFKRITFA